MQTVVFRQCIAAQALQQPSSSRLAQCPRALPCRARFAQLRAPRHTVRMAAAAAEAEPVVQAEPESATTKKYLLSIGWDRAWADVVVERLTKNKQLGANAASCKAAVEYLLGLGIPTQSVCNMASLTHEIMGISPQQLEGVVSYIQSRGVQGDELVTMLEGYPKLLTFTAAGNVLEKGKARASVDVVDMGGQRKAVVNYWREGAVFRTAPVAPAKPEAA